MTTASTTRARSGETTLLRQHTLDTPIGPLNLVALDDTLVALEFDDDGDHKRRRLERRFGAIEFKDDRRLSGIVKKVRAYFGGDLDAIDDLPADAGGTPFQREVWRALREIPCGHTTSYGELAAEIGRPRAVRAVGLANGDNPVAVVIPCHRVIGRNGHLTGYGGGLERKRWLLRHEGALLV